MHGNYRTMSDIRARWAHIGGFFVDRNISPHILTAAHGVALKRVNLLRRRGTKLRDHETASTRGKSGSAGLPELGGRQAVVARSLFGA
jgi:hypothetical protein